MRKLLKAQVWYTDFILGLLIFTVTATMVFKFAVDNSLIDTGSSELAAEAQALSEDLMGTGYPEDWDQDSIIRIGITDGEHVLDKSKLAMLSGLVNSSYDRIRIMSGLTRDFQVEFRDRDGNLLSDLSFGSPYGGMEDADDVVAVRRYLVMRESNTSIVEMAVMVWE